MSVRDATADRTVPDERIRKTIGLVFAKFRETGSIRQTYLWFHHETIGNQFFLAQVAYIARRLDAIQEGPRTALDNTMLLFLSSMLTGNHDASELPVVLLGGAGGQSAGGRVLDYRGQPDRQMCRLYLSMMAKMGVQLPRFGDASRALAEV